MGSQTLESLFLGSLALVAYTYLAYPLGVALLARLWRRPTAAASPPPAMSVSVVMAVFNESGTIHRRLLELCRGLDAAGPSGEVILVSDGSTDDTVAVARAFSDPRVRVIELPNNLGKAAALSQGCAQAAGDVLVFADARQRWAPDTLARLLAPFSDPIVGAAGGELVIEGEDGVLAGVGLYWRYEKWLRLNESRLHSCVGVSGSISAVRRCLFMPIPAGTILDDVYWPLCVVMQGYRVAHTGSALAFDRLPHRARDEFRRKVRTLSGNFQLLTLLPQALLPWRNPVWVQFLSHKLARLLVPWALLGMLVSSGLLGGPVYRGLFLAQVAAYSIAVLGLLRLPAWARRALSPASSFLVLNAAAWLAFWVWLSGGAGRSWKKVNYREASP